MFHTDIQCLQPGFDLHAFMHENWKGKTDPTERRRIQNRLNQRAFRHRQRAGLGPPKQYRLRKRASMRDETPTGSESSRRNDESEAKEPTPEPDEFEDGSVAQAGHSVVPPPPGDKLGRVINRGLMNAVRANATYLGIGQAALAQRTPITTPRCSRDAVPATLFPVELQHQVLHDPIIDTIPHAGFRHNVLKALAAGEIDALALSQAIRCSGWPETIEEGSDRGGFVVWRAPADLAGWEMSELFFRQWSFLLMEDCEDLVAATNAYRAERGLMPLSLPFFRVKAA